MRGREEKTTLQVLWKLSTGGRGGWEKALFYGVHQLSLGLTSAIWNCQKTKWTEKNFQRSKHEEHSSDALQECAITLYTELFIANLHGIHIRWFVISFVFVLVLAALLRLRKLGNHQKILRKEGWCVPATSVFFSYLVVTPQNTSIWQNLNWKNINDYFKTKWVTWMCATLGSYLDLSKVLEYIGVQRIILRDSEIFQNPSTYFRVYTVFWWFLSLRASETSSQAPSYARRLQPETMTHSLTGVKCRATSVANNQ